MATVVFIYTYLLFKETGAANQTSKDALALNKQQFKQSIIDNKEASKKQSQREKEEAINRGRQFILDSTSTQAQINSSLSQIRTLQQSQNQFEAVNQPQIQIVGFNRITFDTSSLPFIGYIISTNIAQSVKMTSQQPTLTLLPSKIDSVCVKSPDSVINTFKKTIIYGQYYVSQYGVGLNWYATQSVLPEMYESVKNGTMNVYFMGEIKYTNLVSGKPRIYRFIYKLIFPKDNNDWSFLPIYNFNKDE